MVSSEEFVIEGAYHAYSLGGASAQHLLNELNAQLQVIVPLIIFKRYVAAFD